MTATLAGQAFSMSEGLLAAGLGLGLVLGKVTLDKLREVLNHAEFKNTLDDHTLHEKHDFDEYCGPNCIMETEKNIKEILNYGVDKRGTGYIHFQGNCHHGCTIKINLALPKVWKFWDISSAHHIGPCYAKTNLFKNNV